MSILLKKPYIPVFLANYNVRNVICTIIYAHYLALSLIHFITQNMLLLQIAIALGLFALILVSTRIRRQDVPIYILVGFLSTFTLVSSLFISRTGSGIVVFLSILSNAGIAMILLRGHIYSWGGYIPFYGLSAYFLLLILSRVAPEFTLEFSSVNGISIVMLAACISLYIVLSINNKNNNIDLIPAVITVVISIWAIGRSGIISSILILSGLLFVRLRAKPKYIYVVIACLLLTYFIIHYLNVRIAEYVDVEKAINYALARETWNAERNEIWANYFNNLDLFSIIFGMDVFQNAYMSIWDYNYHNSLITLHSYTGLMGLIVMILILFSLYRYCRTNHVYFILLLAIMLRMQTDSCNFITLYDFIPFFFIFYILRSVSFSSLSLFIYRIQRKTWGTVRGKRSFYLECNTGR